METGAERLASRDICGDQHNDYMHHSTSDCIILNCTCPSAPPPFSSPQEAGDHSSSHCHGPVTVNNQRIVFDSWSTKLIAIITLTVLWMWYTGAFRSSIHVNPSCDIAPSPLSPHLWLLPPPPMLYGRDTIREDLVERILHSDGVRRHICLRGLPWVGKSALGTSIMHDRRIIKHFSAARHWVAFEKVFNATSNLDDLLRHVALSFGLKLNPCGDPRKEIAHFMYENDVPRIIMLDGLETMWKPKNAIEAAEDVLLFLAQFPQLSILITTHNGHEPAAHRGMPWSVIDPIQPLPEDESKMLFLSLTTTIETPEEWLDDTLGTFLEAVDNMPQPVVLMASYAQENYTMSQILEKWDRGFWRPPQLQKTIDYNDPMTILNNTITSFLREPMDFSPDVVTLLRIISGFPRGVVEEKHIQSLVPDIPDAVGLARTLARGSVLIRSSDGLFHMHAVIRWFMLSHYSIEPLHEKHIRQYYPPVTCNARGKLKPANPYNVLDDMQNKAPPDRRDAIQEFFNYQDHEYSEPSENISDIITRADEFAKAMSIMLERVLDFDRALDLLNDTRVESESEIIDYAQSINTVP